MVEKKFIANFTSLPDPLSKPIFITFIIYCQNDGVEPGPHVRMKVFFLISSPFSSFSLPFVLSFFPFSYPLPPFSRPLPIFSPFSRSPCRFFAEPGWGRGIPPCSPMSPSTPWVGGSFRAHLRSWRSLMIWSVKLVRNTQSTTFLYARTFDPLRPHNEHGQTPKGGVNEPGGKVCFWGRREGVFAKNG